MEIALTKIRNSSFERVDRATDRESGPGHESMRKFARGTFCRDGRENKYDKTK